MHQYNEADRVRLLEALSIPNRVVFALLCASRLLPQYSRFHEKTGRGDSRAINALAERLWQHVTVHPMSHEELQHAVDQCMDLIPVEDQGWDDQTQPYAEDAAAALAYALRTALSGESQEAAWASRCAYETMDYYAGIGQAGYDEQARIQHPVVQAELGRQMRDLAELRALEEASCPQAIEEFRRRAEQEAITVFLE